MSGIGVGGNGDERVGLWVEKVFVGGNGVERVRLRWMEMVLY